MTAWETERCGCRTGQGVLPAGAGGRTAGPEALRRLKELPAVDRLGFRGRRRVPRPAGLGVSPHPPDPDGIVERDGESFRLASGQQTSNGHSA